VVPREEDRGKVGGELFTRLSFPSQYRGACADVTAMRACLGGAILNVVYKGMDKDGATR
jgi:hypothetical protein